MDSTSGATPTFPGRWLRLAKRLSRGFDGYAGCEGANARGDVYCLVDPSTARLYEDVPAGTPRGLRVSRQSRLVGSESYEARSNPYGRPYFWSVFSQPTAEPEPGSDVAAVREGWVAVTPLEATESAEESLGLVEDILELTEEAAAAPGSSR